MSTLPFLLLHIICMSEVAHSRKWSDISIERRPNIVLILTDDQDIALGSMEFMPKTLRLLRFRGAEFVNAFVTTPICCPSRSSILTGLYVHNHHVLTNNQNCSGHDWRSVHESRTFGAYLQRSGYRTGYFGKYLNDYDGSYVPPGWHDWLGLVKNSRFYNYTVNYNGRLIKHGFDYRNDYFTDLITNDSLTFLQQQRRLYHRNPLLLVLSFPAPHGPEDPAPKYAHMFRDVKTHRTEAWNYAPNPDKQWLLRRTGKMEPVHVVFTDMLHRRRLQTLQSVDDNVQRIIKALRDMRELSNTYVIYSSDHGYHLGQFGLIKGKNMPYEFDIKVPFFVRGPDIPRGLRVVNPVANIDITPTILDMAKLPIPSFMDGRSLLDLLHNKRKNPQWRQTVLIERGKMPKLNRIRERLMRQRDQFSKEVRITEECTRKDLQSPCTHDQRWECKQNESGRWRIFKCRAEIEMEEKCSCRERRKRRKQHTTVLRRKIRQKRSYSENFKMKRIDLVHVFGEEYGSDFKLPEEVIDVWENEFLQDIYQANIIGDGQWFQGDFGHSRKRRIRRNSDNALCVHLNVSVVCEPRVYKNSTIWTRQKSKVDGKIVTLRRQLSAFKDIRKHLRRGRPSRDNGNANFDSFFQNRTKSKRCHCDMPQFHPLQSVVKIAKRDRPRTRIFFFLDFRFARLPKRTSSIERRAPPKTGTRRWHRLEKKLHCNADRMNCFSHNAQHWRTPPLWPSVFGEFCFCQNSNNNTYWCLRTINDTSNFLYCEFVTEFLTFYDLNADPQQLTNAVYSLSLPILDQLSAQLAKLKECHGADECEHYTGVDWPENSTLK